MLLYAIDGEEAYEDDNAFALADLLYNEYVFPQQHHTGKFDFYVDISMLLLSLVNLFYVAALLITERKYDLNKDRAGTHFMDKYYAGELAYLLTKLDTDDKNVAMLADLVVQVERCYDTFLNIKRKP